jgi:lysozyme
MRISPNGLTLLKRFEGFRAKPYLCSAGVPTIGYGNTYYENGIRVKLTDSPIDENWAEQLLKSILTHYELGVDSVTTDNITQNQFDALVIFAYNVGVVNFKKSTLLKLVNENPYDLNIAKQFMRWTRAGGKVIKGLVLRRNLESHLYFKV